MMRLVHLCEKSTASEFSELVRDQINIPSPAGGLLA